jgi:hypothetical protein
MCNPVIVLSSGSDSSSSEEVFGTRGKTFTDQHGDLVHVLTSESEPEPHLEDAQARSSDEEWETAGPLGAVLADPETGRFYDSAESDGDVKFEKFKKERSSERRRRPLKAKKRPSSSTDLCDLSDIVAHLPEFSFVAPAPATPPAAADSSAKRAKTVPDADEEDQRVDGLEAQKGPHAAYPPESDSESEDTDAQRTAFLDAKRDALPSVTAAKKARARAKRAHFVEEQADDDEEMVFSDDDERDRVNEYDLDDDFLVHDGVIPDGVPADAFSFFERSRRLEDTFTRFDRRLRRFLGAREEIPAQLILAYTSFRREFRENHPEPH